MRATRHVLSVFWLTALLALQPFSFSALSSPVAAIIDTTHSPHAILRPLPYDAVQWTTGFWADRFHQLSNVSLPEMWSLLAAPDAGHVLENFRVAAGQSSGSYAGTNWQDEWLYKWIEAAACVWRTTRDPWLRDRMNESIALIAAAQQPDGYISTKIIARKLTRYTNPNDHEFYNMGHLLTAAAIHHRMTGETTFLDIARKTADHACDTLGVIVEPFMAHNPSIVMGLVDMYRVTGEKRYLECAQLVVDRRGTKPRLPYPQQRPGAHVVPGSDLIQDRIPVRKSTEFVGQNVFSTYLYSGAADIVAETGETALDDALHRLWHNLTQNKMYVHGGISALARGVSGHHIVSESAGRPYDLPNTHGYNETCGQIGVFMWAARMLCNKPDSTLADTMELEMYNGFLGGIGLDGKSWFYRNVLRRYEKNYKPADVSTGPLTDMAQRSQPGLRNICCPSNLLRTFAELSSYFYSTDSTGALWVHHYGGSRATLENFAIEQITDYPWNGDIRIVIKTAPAQPATLNLRIPEWAPGFSLLINGVPAQTTRDHGYAAITRTWNLGDTVTLTLPMDARLLEANPAIEQTRNQVAVKRGPLVYCLESPDLPAHTDIRDIVLPACAHFIAARGLTTNSGNAAGQPFADKIVTLQTAALARSVQKWDTLYRTLNTALPECVSIKLIPYFSWSNRGPSAMSVWLPLASPSTPVQSAIQNPKTEILTSIASPILLHGNARTAYRDPLLIHHEGTFYLYYSYVLEEEDRLIYWYVAVSTSTDLKNWSAPRILTPKEQNLNYSSPGNIVCIGSEWLMCLQTYPIADFRRGDKLRFCDARARIFTMRSKDLLTWTPPELIRVKGPAISEKNMGKMIDPFLLRDKDTPGQWWCFYKQDGHMHASLSTDLKTWTPGKANIAEGENACVLWQDNEYVFFYAPANGVGVKRGPDLARLREDIPPLVFGQKNWPWAETRLTAGYVEDLRHVPGIGKYVMVFHGMGPGKHKTDANTNANCSIGIAWSDDLKTWHWPDESPNCD